MFIFGLIVGCIIGSSAGILIMAVLFVEKPKHNHEPAQVKAKEEECTDNE